MNVWFDYVREAADDGVGDLKAHPGGTGPSARSTANGLRW
jgi:hypothetical protein